MCFLFVSKSKLSCCFVYLFVSIDSFYVFGVAVLTLFSFLVMNGSVVYLVAVSGLEVVPFRAGVCLLP